MAEIDPVILDIIARDGEYRTRVVGTAKIANGALGSQEKSVQRLEAQMRKSSGAISGQLRGLAATLGTLFTGRELVGLIDGFTRVQNSLRVAGLEGQKLEAVQSDLLDLSTRYGVSIEGLANLYGKATDAGRSFGASEGEVLKLTEATSQALLITGTNAQQASGAILGLSQALASGTVRAEEYNQINEGGLRPLLQAAAASAKYGGDINKLRSAVLAGKVSSQEFFAAIQAGSAQLEGQASKATLTLSGAFEALTSRLTVYVGEAAKANGASQALAAGIILLADNLDTLFTVLAVVGTALGVGLVTNAALARVALIATAGAATTATAVFTRLVAVLGGPIGIAITAVAAGLAFVAAKSGEAAEATGQYARQAEAMRQIQDKVTDATDRLASATGKARAEALANARALREETRQYLANAQAALIAAEAKAVQARERARQELTNLPINSGAGGGPDRLNGVLQRNTRPVIDANANAKQAQANVINAQKEIARLGKIIDAAAPPAIASVGDDKKKPKGREGPTGPSAAEIEQRFNSELASIAQQTLSARQQLATNAEDRAELELRGVELARVQALESLAADKDYTAAQKARVADALENLAEVERSRVERQRIVDIEQERADVAQALYDAESDSLRQQYDLAKSSAERRDLAYEMIELDYRYREALLASIIASEATSEAEKERARIAQTSLAASKGRSMEAARRDTAGPLEAYMDSAKRDAGELNDLYESIAVDGLQSLNDGLADAIVNSKNLGDVFKNVAKQIIADLIRIAIQQQIVNALGSLLPGFGGGGGGLSGIVAGGKTFNVPSDGFGDLGKIFGRAGGGPVNAGQVYRVNEVGQEFFQPASSGRIIPVGEMNRRAAQGGTGQSGPIEIRVYAEEGAMFVPRVEAISEGQAVKVTVAAAPALTQRAVSETQRQMSRPRMPGAGR